MIKTFTLLAVTAGAATASPWAGQASKSAAFVGAPVGRSAPWGLGTRWLQSTPTSTTARVASVSRSAGARLDALSMKLGEDEKVRVELFVLTCDGSMCEAHVCVCGVRLVIFRQI